MTESSFKKFEHFEELEIFLTRIERLIEKERTKEKLSRKRSDRHLNIFMEAYQEAERAFASRNPQQWRSLRQRIDRLRQLLLQWHYFANLIDPADKEEFKSSLYWFSQSNDLKALQKLSDLYSDPPFDDQSIAQLIFRSGCQLANRVYTPEKVVRYGEKTFCERRNEWEALYPNKYIAIAENQVFAAAESRRTLNEKIEALRGPFHKRLFYIVKTGKSIIFANCPKQGQSYTFQRGKRDPSHENTSG